MRINLFNPSPHFNAGNYAKYPKPLKIATDPLNLFPRLINK